MGPFEKTVQVTHPGGLPRVWKCLWTDFLKSSLWPRLAGAEVHGEQTAQAQKSAGLRPQLYYLLLYEPSSSQKSLSLVSAPANGLNNYTFLIGSMHRLNEINQDNALIQSLPPGPESWLVYNVCLLIPLPNLQALLIQQICNYDCFHKKCHLGTCQGTHTTQQKVAKWAKSASSIISMGNSDLSTVDCPDSTSNDDEAINRIKERNYLAFMEGICLLALLLHYLIC